MASEATDVAFFRTLLQFRTVSAEGPTSGAYSACCNWLEAQCKELGLSTSIVEPVAGKPVLVATLAGTEPSLPTVVLNSHYDVVPAMADHWDVDPWAAIEREGRIYGRGAQDRNPHKDRPTRTQPATFTPTEPRPYFNPNPSPDPNLNSTPDPNPEPTQDMKCVVASYILALKRLLAARGGAPFRRTLHLTFVPDEEIGGKVICLLRLAPRSCVGFHHP